MMETDSQPDPLCSVRVVDAKGKPWTMAVRAKSLYRAVFAYNAEQVAGTSKHYPRLEPDLRIEVVDPKGRTMSTTMRDALAWANRQTSKHNGKRSAQAQSS